VDFAQFSRGHIEYDAKGGEAVTTEAGWDFVNNIDFSAPVDADLGKDSALPSVDSIANPEYFIRFEGQDWMRLEDFSLGLSQTGSLDTGGGGGAGKASATDLSFTLGSSAELLQLEDALTLGKHLKNLEIEAYHVVGDGKQLVDQYVFQDLLVTSLQTANSVANQVTVDFAQFSRGHIEYDAKGGEAVTTEAGWDFVNNIQFHAPVDSDLF
jgi:type VI secretion system secreted protein Hcp